MIRTDFKMNIPEPVRFVLDRLTGAGHSAHCVGGCVRDSLMGKTPSDFDVTTSARPDEMQNVFSDCRVVETGLKHGTLTVVREHMNIEITTYRIDGAYGDCRHPENVIFTDRLSDDLCRRDFTVNAMAYSEQNGLTDLFGGIGDLEKKVIRCVGNAEERFSEDGLRILRALRFSSVLGFAPDSECSDAIRKLTPLLSNISRERIYTEITKLLGGKNCAGILSSFPETVAFAMGIDPDDVKYAAERIENDDLSSPLMRYSLMLSRKTEDEARRLFGELKPSNEEKNKVMSYLRYRDYECRDLYSVRHLMCLTDSSFPKELSLFRSLLGSSVPGEAEKTGSLTEDILKKGLCYSLAQLEVKGNDLIEAGYRGQDIGNTLRSLLDKVLRDEIPNDRETLLGQIGKGQ